MAYFPTGLGPQSDTSSVNVLAAGVFVAGSSGGAFSSAVATQGFRSVDFVVYLTTMASVTEIALYFLASELASPNLNTPGDWFPILTEGAVDPDTQPGVFETAPYGILVEDLSASNNGTKMCFSVPVRGAHVRCVLAAKTGSVGGSSTKVEAMRRV